MQVARQLGAHPGWPGWKPDADSDHLALLTHETVQVHPQNLRPPFHGGLS
jgi:hypothetical protein